MPYVTPSQLRLVLPDAGKVADATADDEALTAIITRAQSVVDGYCGRTWADAEESASAHVFYGSGSPRLKIDWTDTTITAAEVALPDSWTAPTFVEMRNAASDTLYLQTTGTDGSLVQPYADYYPYVWPAGLPITVTAEWGYATIPGDVVEATVLIATARWRETYAPMDDGAGWLGNVGLDFEIPPNAREILDRLRMANTFTVGGGF